MSGQVAEVVGDPLQDAIETIDDPLAAATATPVREEREEMPLPTEPRTIFQGGMFLLALLAALYIASPIVLPVVLAIVLKLLLQPLVRLTDRVGAPRALGAV